MSQNLSITQTGPVARLTLTQPAVRNDFRDEVIAAITAAFTEVGARRDVRVVVLAAERLVALGSGGVVIKMQHTIAAPTIGFGQEALQQVAAVAVAAQE